MLRNADVGGGVSDFLKKKRYEGVMFNVIISLRGGGWGPISRKIAFVTLE